MSRVAGLEVPVVGASGSFAKAGEAHRREQTEQLKKWAEIAHCDIAFPHYMSYIKKYLGGFM
ncbi:hypothetical protein FACS1894110_22930 [Spirochaetia bacterium]|nr:hypothetical protein FACS1894110_22930 [Spirochaetia bacterium]